MREEQAVALIAELIAGRQPARGLIIGPGDDCAVVRPAVPLAMTSDMLVDKVHFRTDYMSYYEIGRRAMAVNLSDLAAMGAEPAYGLLSLGLPAAPEEHMLRDLLNGMLDMGEAYGLALVGGDTVKSPALTISLSLLGELPYPALTRAQARVGHDIWVTGPLGLSAAGMFALQHNLAWPELARAHISPVPRLQAGRILAAHKLNGAVMDISDGLATDLARVCRASGVGAVIDNIPLDPAMLELAASQGQNALDWALYGGEDFELLFTCSRSEQAIIPLLRASGLQPARVGQISVKPGVYLQTPDGDNIAFKGYDHFRPA